MNGQLEKKNYKALKSLRLNISNGKSTGQVRVMIVEKQYQHINGKIKKNNFMSQKSVKNKKTTPKTLFYQCFRGFLSLLPLDSRWWLSCYVIDYSIYAFYFVYYSS